MTDGTLDAERRLHNTAARDTRGEGLGGAESVVLDGFGRSRAANVEVGGHPGADERVAPLKPEQFIHREQRDILVTTAGKAEVESLPTVPQ